VETKNFKFSLFIPYQNHSIIIDLYKINFNNLLFFWLRILYQFHGEANQQDGINWLGGLLLIFVPQIRAKDNQLNSLNK